MIGILIFLALIPAAIALVMWLQVRSFSSPSLKLSPEDLDDFLPQLKDSERLNQWASQNGFVWEGCYTLLVMQKIFIAAWRNPSEQGYFCMYFLANRRVYDFFTLFSKDFSLTSSNSADGNMLPSPPGRYMESLSDYSLEELYDRHLASKKFLIEKCKIPRQSIQKSFEEIFVPSLQQQMAYVKSISWWYLRATYWYFVRRMTMRNKSVEEQIERGLSVHPQDVLLWSTP